MKIYTKGGDDGTTGLLSSRRLPKDDVLFHAYGTVDELNSVLGIARTSDLPAELDPSTGRIQSELFQVGADLAAPWDERASERPGGIARLSPKLVDLLEDEIDAAERRLSPLRQFILPGGTAASAWLHHGRTVCRRAERWTVTALNDGRCNPETVRYLNRLSDWLFVMARLANHIEGVKDIPWSGHP